MKERKERILIVDDEESLRAPLQIAFQSEGFEVSVASDGPEALQLLKEEAFHLLLTDLMMPKMNGIQLMEEARRVQPDLVVVLMTGFGTVETAVKALKGGAYDYVLKPFKLDEIMRAVKRGLEHQKLQAENVQLQELNRRLAEVDRIKMNLLRAISHEFRTPLTVICGWVDLVSSEMPLDRTPLLAEALKAIRESSMCLNRMVSNLLEFVALSADRIRLRREEVDLPSLIEELQGQLEEKAKEKEVSFQRSFASDLAPVPVDREKMKLALFNLVENAVKFNGRGGTVRVEGEVARGEGRFLLRIQNSLGEIPEDRLSELLKPFTQADMSITRSSSGLGLGLAVAKGIVEAHQGRMRIWSEPGAGTTVELQLPLYPSS
jgi:signal transduction histidine kinase